MGTTHILLKPFEYVFKENTSRLVYLKSLSKSVWNYKTTWLHYGCVKTVSNCFFFTLIYILHNNIPSQLVLISYGDSIILDIKFLLDIAMPTKQNTFNKTRVVIFLFVIP